EPDRFGANSLCARQTSLLCARQFVRQGVGKTSTECRCDAKRPQTQMTVVTKTRLEGARRTAATILPRTGMGLWGSRMVTSTRFPGMAIAVFALAAAGCSEGQPQQAKAPPPPTVTVAKPVRKLVVDQDEYVGRFVAVDMVEVRARVGGYLDRINFTDGQMVKQGDTLFVIDRRPYEHILDQAKANLAQARANLAF